MPTLSTFLPIPDLIPQGILTGESIRNRSNRVEVKLSRAEEPIPLYLPNHIVHSDAKLLETDMTRCVHFSVVEEEVPSGRLEQGRGDELPCFPCLSRKQRTSERPSPRSSTRVSQEEGWCLAVFGSGFVGVGVRRHDRRLMNDSCSLVR